MSLDIDGTFKGEKLSGETLDQIFSQLNAEHIEQFYMAYQLWSQRQQIEQLQLQMQGLQQKIDENTQLMLQFQPSAIALASLAQLQACGVEDADLLDTMLERGEEWLDHSIELLERCEQLDLIGGDYTQWCRHALEGAYDWLDSMTDPSAEATTVTDTAVQEEIPVAGTEVTEEQLLKMLMSEEGDVEKPAQNVALEQKPRITQPLTIVDEGDEQDGSLDETQKVAIINPRKPITQPLPPIDEPVATLDAESDIEEATQQVAVIKPITQPPPSIDEPVLLDEHIDSAEETQQVPIVKPITQPLPSIDEPALLDEHRDTIEETRQVVQPIDQSIPPLDEPAIPDEQVETPSVEMAAAAPDESLSTVPDNTIEGTQEELVADNDAEQPIQASEIGIQEIHPVNIEENESSMVDSTEPVGELAPPDHIQDEEHTISVEENKPQLQDVPSSKKKAQKKKKGFLHWLLAKILRR